VRDEEPRGLGGWLILVAIGLVITAVRTGYLVMRDFLPLVTGGGWTALTDPASEAYHPLWGPLLVFEFVGSSAIIAVAVIGLLFFFQRARAFPNVMIGLYLGGLGFVIADYLVSEMIPAVADMGDTEALREIGRSATASLIWVPYMLRSRRVRNTFTAGEAAVGPAAEP
jgi:hypothetical protein